MILSFAETRELQIRGVDAAAGLQFSCFSEFLLTRFPCKFPPKYHGLIKKNVVESKHKEIFAWQQVCCTKWKIEKREERKDGEQ
jgi:hypothetical protein